MKRWKWSAFGFATVIAASAIFGLSRCSHSDHSTDELTEAEEADLNQKAMEAELAEQKIAQVATTDATTDAPDEAAAKPGATKPGATKPGATKNAPAKVAEKKAAPAHHEAPAKVAAVAAKETKPKNVAEHKPEQKPEHKPEHKTVAKAETAAATATEATRKPASKASGYVVQAGAFRVKENAEKFQSKLKEMGYPVVMQTIEHSKNGTLHLVRSEPMNTRDEAKAVAEKLKEKDVNATVMAVKGM